MQISKIVLFIVLALGSWSARAAVPEALGEIDGRVVWVDFWASWCVPCKRSFPWMNEMHRRYAEQGLQIIAVNLDAERAAADEFLRTTPAQFALRFDPEGELAEAFEVEAMPTSYLIDAATGRILERHLGFKVRDSAIYESAIKAALSATSGYRE